MDTYWDNDYSKCVHCCRCVKACREDGKNFLVGVRDKGPEESSDYVPCHHCTDRFTMSAPCQLVCHYDAIKITRW